ncbi:quercetin dioxygenase-like cupin family protein [Pseudomonas sp. TE3786]
MKKTIASLLLSTLTAGHALSAENNPNISDAPDSGKLPLISPYRTTLPDLYDFDKAPVEKTLPGVTRQLIHGAQGSLTRWVFAKDAVVPLHHQPHEQFTWIIKGSVEVISQGKRYVVSAGQVIIFPPNVPHQFRALEEGTVNVDFFTPARQDWIDGASYNKLK